ncbi:cupredoxin domain-containing protein [Marinobacter similis]|uniref:Copper-binding protein n=1 Tax=Marinobacter similis TaxID=1420916 RepID=W5YGM8_9GAMM|nr:cupredoxin domain-containing protein [Marinobacter similis]AHI28170.1 copper-binding protein [Marinobacter similis]
MSTPRLVIATLAMSFAMTAMGAGSHQSGHGQGHGMSGGKPGEASEASRTIKIDMHDNYYEPESIDVKAGETVRFVVSNKGSLVHEFNIGTPDMHEARRSEMMMLVEHGVIQGGTLNHDMMGMDMGSGHSMKQDDPNSILLEPGESKEVVWKFTGSGDIEFACNVPGHYQAGMYGDVNVN